MQLYFVRHGQSANNALWSSTGSSAGRSHDPELTEVGWRQAERVGQFLKQGDPSLVRRGTDPQNLTGFNITHVYCSLMVRAVNTGHIIAEALDLPLYSWLDLHEEGGLYLDDEVTGAQVGQAGNTRTYFQANYPRLVLPHSLAQGGWWNRPFETVEERLPRARRFLSDLLERHGRTQDHVVMVSHGGFYNWFLVALLNLPDTFRFWFVLNNAAITRCDFNEDELNREVTRIVYMNRVDFLPPDLVT